MRRLRRPRRARRRLPRPVARPPPRRSAPAPDAAQVLKESARTTQTLRSIHLNLVATDLPKLPVEKVDADVTSIEQGNGQAIGNADFRLSPDAAAVPTDFLVTRKTFYTKESRRNVGLGGAVGEDLRPGRHPRQGQGSGQTHFIGPEPGGGGQGDH